jgi:hypothetical protein
MKQLYYIITPSGSGLRAGISEAAVLDTEIRRNGYSNTPSVVRLATDQDINHVKGMGGHFPELD